MTINAWEECFNLINWYYNSLRVIFMNWTAKNNDKTFNDDQRWSEFSRTALI